MRTTLTLDDNLARELRERAHEQGVSFEVMVNETIQAGLRGGSWPARLAEFRSRTFSMGFSKGGLAKALQLSTGANCPQRVAKLQGKW